MKNSPAPHFPRVIVYAPGALMGIGVPEFEFSQGILKVEKVMSHLKMKSTLGTLIQIVLEWRQITAGIQSPILDDTSRLQYVYSLRGARDILWFISSCINFFFSL